ncbi:MAG: ABC transporter substrate-binding protein [Frankia sp.]
MTAAAATAARVTATAATAALVACSGSGGASPRPGGNPGSGTSDATACPATPGVSARTLSLGLLYSATGSAAAAFSPYRAGVDARLGVANAAGGINGRTVTYAWVDDRSETGPNLAGAHQLIDGDRALAVLEESTAASGSAAYLHSIGAPVLGTPYDIVWTQDSNMFSYSTYFSAGAAVSTIGDYATRRGGTRAVVISSGHSGASRIADDKLAASLTAGKVRVVGRLDPSARVNIATLGAAVKRLRADVLTGAGAPATFLRVAAAATAKGARLKAVIAPYGYDENVPAIYGKTLPTLAVYLTYLPFELNRPAHQRFRAAMAVYSPQTPADSAVALDGWINADMVLRGLSAAGRCPTRAGYIAALRGVRGYNAGGLLAQPVDFQADFGRMNTCYVFARIAPSRNRWTVDQPVPLCGRRLDD